jgi:hypothetical protein
LLDVVAVEGDIGCSRRGIAIFRGVNSKVGLRRIKDQPATSDIGAGKSELVLDEFA